MRPSTTISVRVAGHGLRLKLRMSAIKSKRKVEVHDPMRLRMR
jgi:hypothetical protein